MTRSRTLIVAWLVMVLTLAFIAHAKADRAYVIYGQGGAVTSMGMRSLASRLATIPGLTVTTHKWKYPNVVVNDIRRQRATERIILIGYSLGANATTWISSAVRPRTIDLAVAYDPSVYSYLRSVGTNVRRFILYHNNGRSRFGHAYIEGKQVETIEINEGHLSVDFDQRLHARTIEAVKRAMRR